MKSSEKPKRSLIKFYAEPETDLLKDSFSSLFDDPGENYIDDEVVCIYTHFTQPEYVKYKNLKYVVAPCTNILHLNPDSHPDIKFIYLDTSNNHILPRLYLSVHSSAEWVVSALYRILKFDKSVELRGKSVGFIGYGRMGQLIAKKLSTSEVEISYFSVKEASLYINSKIKRVDTMDEILTNSDIIIMGCTYDTVTDNIIDSEEFKKMCKKPYFINNTRSRVVNGLSLINAIQNGFLRGCGIDVYEQYPSYVQTALSNMGADSSVNLYFTRHVAGKGGPSRIATDQIVYDELKGILNV